MVELVDVIGDFTQQDGWKTQDDRMTKKGGARLCVPRLRNSRIFCGRKRWSVFERKV